MSHDEPPRGRDSVIVAALIAGATLEMAAATADCSVSTVKRVRATWADHITANRDHRAEQAAASLLALFPKALAAYADLVDSPLPSVRRSAAHDVMTLALRWRDSVEYERFVTMEAAGPPTPLPWDE